VCSGGGQWWSDRQWSVRIELLRISCSSRFLLTRRTVKSFFTFIAKRVVKHMQNLEKGEMIGLETNEQINLAFSLLFFHHRLPIKALNLFVDIIIQICYGDF
jgi:hypothetical protein